MDDARRRFEHLEPIDLEPTSALDDLRAAMELLDAKPTEAATRLRLVGSLHHDRFGIGAADHGAYRAAHISLHGAPLTPSEVVRVTTFEAMADPRTARDLLGFAADSPQGFVLVRVTDADVRHGAGGELEALALLESQPELDKVAIGTSDLMLRGEQARGSTTRSGAPSRDQGRSGRGWAGVAP